MTEYARFRYIYYISEANGRSQDKVKCECGRIVYVYRWRGEKKCDCGKIINTHAGALHEDESIPLTLEDRGIHKTPHVKVTAVCSGCGEIIEWDQGWSHKEEKNHAALPLCRTIHKEEVS
jgi:hypothetical protein